MFYSQSLSRHLCRRYYLQLALSQPLVHHLLAVLRHRLRPVPYDESLESQHMGVEGCAPYAEIVGQSAHVHFLHFELVQLVPQGNALLALEEGAVGVLILVEPLVNDELLTVQLEVLVDLSAVGALHAVVRPQFLLPSGQLNRGKGLFSVCRGERYVSSRMPVFAADDVRKEGALLEFVDDWEDERTASHSQTPALTEIVLHVHNHQCPAHNYQIHSLFPLS